MKQELHSFAMVIAIFSRSCGRLNQSQMIALSHLLDSKGGDGFGLYILIEAAGLDHGFSVMRRFAAYAFVAVGKVCG